MRSLRRGVVGIVLVVIAMTVALSAQEQIASDRQVDIVNRKFRSVGANLSMKVGFDPLTGDVTFRFTTKDRTTAIGAATHTDIMHFSTVAYQRAQGGSSSLRVVSSSRIAINPDGSEGKTLNATESQLAQLSHAFDVNGGIFETLTIRLAENGQLSYSFLRADKTNMSDVVAR